MIIGHFVALSTTESSPIWTQMAYPEKGRFQCIVNVQNYELYIPKRWNGKLTSVDFLHCSAFSNAFKILLLQKMHNPADHIFPPQWLVKAFQILIAQLPHDPHLNSSAKGSFSSAAQPNSQPSPHQLSEESSNKQANTNCVSPLTNTHDKLSLHIKELF